MWFVRKWFWIGLGWFKAVMNKPLDIPVPAGGPPIEPVPLAEVVPGLPVRRRNPPLATPTSPPSWPPIAPGCRR